MVLLYPTNIKNQKQQKQKIKGLEYRVTTLEFGSFGLRALETGRLTSKQIEAARQAISRKIKKKGKLWIRIFPQLAVSAKPNEVRMGKGKGAFSFWVCPIKAGKILYEIKGLSIAVAKEALYAGASKLPINTQMVSLL